MTQEQIEALQASESIKHAKLQELARLVLAYHNDDFDEYESAYTAMVSFAKRVAQ
jgi:hypothetical protein